MTDYVEQAYDSSLLLETISCAEPFGVDLTHQHLKDEGPYCVHPTCTRIGQNMSTPWPPIPVVWDSLLVGSYIY